MTLPSAYVYASYAITYVHDVIFEWPLRMFFGIEKPLYLNKATRVGCPLTSVTQTGCRGSSTGCYCCKNKGDAEPCVENDDLK